MKRIACVLLAGVLWMALALHGAAELIPIPSFSNHEVPTTQVPDTDPPVWELIHVALLCVALVLASYFALVKRSRIHLLVLAAASLVWFGFVRDGCVCSVGSTQNVAQALFDPQYTIPLGVLAFFMLPLIFTLFFGRTFCAAVCPLGAAQELVAVRSIKVPRWLDHTLGLIPFFYLGAAVLFAATGTAYLICQYDPIVPFFRASGNANMLIIGGCVMLISVFVGRPYCRYLCPYGAILGLLSRVSRWHLSIVPGECITCRLCEDACPYGAIQPPTVAPSPQLREQGKRYLGWLLLVVPLLIAALAWLGTTWAVPLSRMDFRVQLAEQVRLEQTTGAEPTDQSDAFRNTGETPAKLFADAIARNSATVRSGAGWVPGSVSSCPSSWCNSRSGAGATSTTPTATAVSPADAASNPVPSNWCDSA